MNDNPMTIGRGFNSACWIVDPSNHNQLAPIGCIGELVIHGHALARGYANNQASSDRAFLTEVAWLRTRGHGEARRLYKTGDLVRYDADGSIAYIGRKDTQVKLRGQRVELGAIEESIKSALPQLAHVAVDVSRRDGHAALVAFVNLGGEGSDDGRERRSDELADALVPMNDTLRAMFAGLADSLRTTLPGYMVPALFLPLRWMPFGATMKLDRKRLRELASGLDQEQVAAYALANEVKLEPTEEAEFRLRDVWAAVLGISAEEIGKNTNFLQVGGDSISAIHLVTAARQRGIGLTVAQIFSDARLAEMAATATEVVDDGQLVFQAEPFSLLPAEGREGTLSEIQAQFGLSPDNILRMRTRVAPSRRV